MKKYGLLLITFLFAVMNVWAQRFPQSSQLIVVKTDGWNTIHGHLSAFEYTGGNWHVVIKDIPVVVGRSGLAWGKGLHKQETTGGKNKKEGDGNAPAGIFPLTGLFGYSDITANMKSVLSDSHTFCVDDPSSKNYNKIVNTDTAKKDWSSAENMLLKSDAYKAGIVVGYNTDPVEAGKGSCIFMHIWQSGTEPTAGCTAMTEENMMKIISFLDKKKQPLLVQLPLKEYKKLRKEYGLP